MKIVSNIKLLLSCSLFFLLVCFSCKKDTRQQEQVSIPKETLFNKLPIAHTGVAFNNEITEDLSNFFLVYNYAYNGGGVAIGDINNDGLSDIYFTGNQVSNKLYLNKGNLKFEDITESAGVTGGKGWSNGVVMADVNGDNLIDIYVCKGGWKGTDKERANLLYINNGDATFTEKAGTFNIGDNGFSMMASFFDMDNDNDLDMYLMNRPNRFFLSHEQIRAGKDEQNPLHSDKLYENVGGSFKEIGQNAGINKTFAYGLGLNTSDIDNNGFSDVYVANDYFESDYFFKNNGNKTFTQKIDALSNHVAFYGMGVDVVDFNNDGFEYLIELDMSPSDHERSKVTMASMNVPGYNRILDQGNHYQYMHNMLQINNGNGFFSEISQYAGVAKTDWSWSCLGSDFDNDGYRDLFISNGYRRDLFDKDATNQFTQYVNSKEKKQRNKKENMEHIVNLFGENKIHNHVYKNNGDLKFISKVKEWGFEDISFSNGAGVGDLDNDGDLDLVVNNINDAAFVYQNNSDKTTNQYLKVKLKGPTKNSAGLGAKITLYTKEGIKYHELKNVRGYLSSVDPIAHFGLGEIKEVDSLKVVWPDRKENKLYKLPGNSLQTVNYEQAVVVSKKKKGAEKTLFKDITNLAFTNKPFVHKENKFDDFKNQILLPHKLSTEGPCITVADVNNDGLEDFFIGGASRQPGALYIQKAGNRFVKKTQLVFLKDANYEDTGAVFFDANADGFKDLYVVSGGNEFIENSEGYQDRLYINNGSGGFDKSKNLPRIASSGSCVLPLDYDNDGDLDVFVGGRLLPNKYPQAAKSYLLENTNGKFIDVIKQKAPELEYVGMVTDAAWQDTNANGSNELIVVGEWMPITVFSSTNGQLTKTELQGLEKTNGWWNSIAANDIDNDGDVDFVLGNLGENYKFKASKEKPFYIYASDYDNNGTNDVFLAKEYKGKIVPIRGKECSTQQLPGLSNKFKTYGEFAKADLGSILGDPNKKTKKQESFIFQSVLLVNDGGNFTINKLPKEAQYSTVQSILIDAYTKDGKSDILLAGNKFNVEIETTRADASVGVLFEATTTGFKPQSVNKSGIFLPENVKVIKSIKLGSDAKKGILVGVNNCSLKLLQQQ